MISLVLWALLIYFLYIATHGVLKLNSSKGDSNLVALALGPRDTVLEKSVPSQRAARAQRNMEEALFFFLPLALLLIMSDKPGGLGATGALIFVVARALYLPSYLLGIFAIRSIVWTASAVGLILMVSPLLT